MMEPHISSSGGGTSDPKWWSQRAESPVPSCVSLKSNISMPLPPEFSGGSAQTDLRGDLLQESRCGVCDDDLLQESSCGVCEQFLTNPVSINCGHSFCRQCISSYLDQSVPSGGFACPQCRKRSRTCPVLHPHKVMVESLKQDSHSPVDEVLHRVLQRHRTSMKNKYESLFEGINSQENKTLLNRIYTQLYVIEGESEGVNEEHEVLQMEKTRRKQLLQDTPINCSDIFKPVQDPEGEMEEENIRVVMTKGIAGIGKTVSVQKFILDWAEGKANQDVDFMFVLPFRELNLIKDHYSVYKLLCDLHPEIKDLDPKIFDVYKVVLIFDGLDESRIPLNFPQCEKVSDINMTSSIGVLMSNLIKGELLPSALIWITSRPAAANQIPPQYINRVTEIQGFTDPQKEEYFRKRISDQDQAEKIISHIKTVKSLHIMCHIPVFCWISATVLQEIFESHINAEIPKTLTEMYIHFLLTQTNMKKQKFGNSEKRDIRTLLEMNRTEILKLAELAFKQLMKTNVLFYEEDLRECGIDLTEASVYSGICTEIFREESVLYQRKVYCFVHLSFQEFFAALYVFHCYVEKNMGVLEMFLHKRTRSSPELTLDVFLKSAVNKALKSLNGHLDLFLRFLHGVSLESNQKLLQGLLTPTQISPESVKKTINNLKQSQKKNVSPERYINLTHCLIEMKNTSLLENIQDFLKGKKSSRKFSLAQCSALAFQLQMSEEVLDELDPKKYTQSQHGYIRLLPALNNCRRALLDHCSLTAETCKILSSVLQTTNCPLRELDLSQNNFCDSGVEHLSAGMRSLQCKLEILRLSSCGLTEESCKSLSSVLQSENPLLRELEINSNDLHDSGVEQLCAGLKSSHCKLQILRLSGCMVTEKGCSSLASALSSNPSHLKELDLTYNHPGESGVKLLSALLEDPLCRLDTLRVDHAGKMSMKPGLRKYVCELTLDPKTAHTRLSLSEGNRKVTCVEEEQSYPDHPERFDHYFYRQVMCRESLSGRCYWEVEWSGGVLISVTYKGIRRKGHSYDCVFGHNVKSWSLSCTNFCYTVRHNNQDTDLPEPPSRSNRVRVYLDWSSGTLSFYSVSSHTHTLTHLHTFHSTFTEPLYAGFGVWGSGSSVCVCEVESETVYIMDGTNIR